MRTIGKDIFIFCLLLLLMASCSKDKEKEAVKSKKQFDRQNAVALIGESGVGSDELTAYVKARSQRRTTPKALDQALNELVVAELLYQEAIRLGIDQIPDVHQSMRQLLGQQLIEHQVNQPVLNRHISQEEVRQYYDDHQDLYARPEQIQVADIFIAAPGDGMKADIDKQRKKAENILVLAQSMNNKRFAFSKLIQKNSDKHPRYRIGNTGFFDINGLPNGIAKELVEAGFALNKSGALADHVVQTTEGFHIIKLVARREAFKRDFDSVALEIEQKIRRKELTEKRAALIASIKKKGNVKINQNVLDDVSRDLPAKVKQGRESGEGLGSEQPVLPGQ